MVDYMLIRHPALVATAFPTFKIERKVEMYASTTAPSPTTNRI